jgi:hypothetical protein
LPWTRSRLLRGDRPARWAKRARVPNYLPRRPLSGRRGGTRAHLRFGFSRHRPGLTAMKSSARKGLSNGKRAGAREPRSQKAETGQAESDRGSPSGLRVSGQGRSEEVTGRPADYRPLYYFASLRDRRLSGFTADQLGSNLPAEHGPWVLNRTISREGVWRHPAPRSLVEASLERDSFYLWIQ